MCTIIGLFYLLIGVNLRGIDILAFAYIDVVYVAFYKVIKRLADEGKDSD